MRKYVAIGRAELLDALQEKGEVFIWMLLAIIPVFVMSSVWIANKQYLTTLSLPQIITYYIVTVAFGWVTEFWFDENLHDEVRTGQFSRFLLRPLHLPFAFIFQNIGRKLFSIPVFLTPSIILISLLLRDQLVTPQKLSLVLFLVFTFIAFFIRYSFSVLAASGAFWWEHAAALVHLRWVLEIIAGGYLLPLSLYPSWLRVISESLPFQFAYYVPVSIFTNAISPHQASWILVKGIVWLGILIAISEWIWRKGVRRYSAVGDKG